VKHVAFCAAAGIGDDVGFVCQQRKWDVVCTLVVLAETLQCSHSLFRDHRLGRKTSLHHGVMKLSEEKAECSAFDCCLGKDTPVQ